MTRLWRPVLLYLTLLGIEGTWLWAALAFLDGAATHDRLTVPTLWLVYPAAFLLHKGLRAVGSPRLAAYAVGIIALGAAILLEVWAQLYPAYALLRPSWLGPFGSSLADMLIRFPPELVPIVGAPVLGWWGWHLAQQRPSLGAAMARFQFGLVMLLGVLGIAALVQTPLPEGVPLTVAFFTLSLAGMAFARGGWGRAAGRLRWPWLLTATIAGVVLIGVLVSAVLTPDALRLLLVPVQWAWGIFMSFLTLLWNLLPKPSPADIALTPMPTPPPVTPDAGTSRLTIPPAVRTALQVILFAIFGGLILAALVRLSSDLWARLLQRLGASDDEREFLPLTLWADFRGWLAELFRRWVRWPGRRRPATPAAAGPIHQVYRNLLRWGQRAGRPRAVSQTPLEYLKTLEPLIPERRLALEVVTRAYLDARYGAGTPSPAEASAVQATWRKLKRDLPRRVRRRVAPARQSKQERQP